MGILRDSKRSIWLQLLPSRSLLSVTCYSLQVTCYLLPVTITPLVARAAEPITIFTTPSDDLNFGVMANKLSVIANAVIPFLVGVAVVAIVWGIFSYIRSAGDTEKIAEGRKVIIYGIIGLFMMLAFWGLVLTVRNSLFGS